MDKIGLAIIIMMLLLTFLSGFSAVTTYSAQKEVINSCMNDKNYDNITFLLDTISNNCHSTQITSCISGVESSYGYCVFAQQTNADGWKKFNFIPLEDCLGD